MIDPGHLVGTGGAIGAILRHYVGVWLGHESFPFGTFTVNVGGSFILGLVTFASLSTDVALLVGTGACGSFTTYSSFSFETVRLWETGDRLRAVFYAGGTFGVCVTAAMLGAGLMSLLNG